MQELERRYPDGLPRLDPVEDMSIDEPAVGSAVRRIEELEKQLATNEVFKVGVNPLASTPCCPPLESHSVAFQPQLTLFLTPHLCST